ncbi:unnamed protein product [Cuscuta epithymum]|uniref:Uncharacterized protein n=1 Tax=Cuscuta epithymum TaxID=186058 RepID=A0AAV0GFK7_9ASTE|nr:unnamed protein product [Cuscuta epithymum]CAH9146744.1 unnamed protein product [Cuscuta epithymum]
MGTGFRDEFVNNNDSLGFGHKYPKVPLILKESRRFWFWKEEDYGDYFQRELKRIFGGVCHFYIVLYEKLFLVKPDYFTGLGSTYLALKLIFVSFSLFCFLHFICAGDDAYVD